MDASIKELLDRIYAFSGKEIWFVNLKNGLKEDDITLDPMKGLELEVIERLFEDYQPRLNNLLLYPIGTAYREHFVLMISSQGSIYGGYDDYLVRIGDSFEAAVENMINDADFEVIPPIA